MEQRICAARGRSEGDWNNGDHYQKLEIGGCISNTITNVQKDNMMLEQYELLNNELVMAEVIKIRKLTERECFRLMGVEDKDIDEIQSAGISRSQQYKMAGNSIVVDVLYHIFDKAFIHPECEDAQLTLF